MSRLSNVGYNSVTEYKTLYARIPFANGNVCCNECMCYGRQSMNCRLSGQINTRPQAGTALFCPLMELDELINLEQQIGGMTND